MEAEREHQLSPPLTVTYLAADFRCDRKTMLRWLRSGEIDGAIQVGRRWQVPMRQLHRPLPPPRASAD